MVPTLGHGNETTTARGALVAVGDRGRRRGVGGDHCADGGIAADAGRVQSRSGGDGTERVRRIDRAVTDDRVVARHRRRRQRRAVRLRRRPLRVVVGDPGRPEQLDGRRLLRDGGHRRRGHRGRPTRPGRVGRRRDGKSRRRDGNLRRRPRRAVRDRRHRHVRRDHRRMGAPVAARRGRVHAPTAGGGELRCPDVPRRSEPDGRGGGTQARPRHRHRRRLGRRVQRVEQRLPRRSVPGRHRRRAARRRRPLAADGVGHT